MQPLGGLRPGLVVAVPFLELRALGGEVSENGGAVGNRGPLAAYSSSTPRISADRSVSFPMPPSSAISSIRSGWVPQTLTL